MPEIPDGILGRLTTDREIHVGVYPDANEITNKLAKALLRRKRKEDRKG